ncbi:alanine--tRNA ligase [Psychrobium sp. 1_MG-2023]|uniref:alanine--tRNA ligase n=1 Tax=Psychrobium sp. 1_MG-2023 TaxID=3062624 RepID=UPI0027365E7A|nr:alanine--tRNA ligase [Psychrobium sp. 1_MG-2023]MDP2562388.1 alanine--tRNA ligase [Psychrobium sp. 1_MG-2023]
MHMSTAEIRDAFLAYYQQQQHQVVASSSLIPGNDATLLFTNAGMVPFKDVFIGTDKRAYNRATSSQRCVRAGGKHNDLENVGYTARHHTFFEMLGNFSFGDYFKREAIKFAWHFLTEELKLPKEKLWVTVFEEDREAEEIWLNEIGVNPDCLSRIGAKDNFWSMGDTGPCGPCTEIFFDHGEGVAGGPPGTPEEDGDRYIEIWNLVFMQFNRQADGTMEDLPKPSVDTGMGLERIAAIMQGVHSNYEIDIFQGLIKAAAKIIGTNDLDNKSLRVIADHIRSCSFLIADGVMPSNEGRGYVLRRIIRRAVRHGNSLGAKGLFFYQLLDELIVQMGQAYPELEKNKGIITKLLKAEEEQFARTLDRGLMILDEALEKQQGKVIDGELVFKLYDTYGFPADLTADIARERDLEIDQAGFESAMAAQRQRAQKASNFAVDYNEQLKLEGETQFLGYEEQTNDALVTALVVDGEEVSELVQDQRAIVVLDQSAFYAESGGQVGDTGTITTSNGVFKVEDTTKIGSVFGHVGVVISGTVSINDKANAEINHKRRNDIALNHSVTHILHAVLRRELGEHVTQKGSLVEADKLRFDFSHFEGVTADQLMEVERMVNDYIRQNAAVETQLMDLEQAKSAGAMALFGEKYDNDVRVVSMGPLSVELCGGTHVTNTGDIGLFKIVSEAGIAAGVRRIEAVTGSYAIEHMQMLENQLSTTASVLKTDSSNLIEKSQQLVEKNRQLDKLVNELKAQLASQQGANLLDNVIEINGIKVLIAQLDGVDSKTLRGSVDELKNKLGSGIVMAAVVDGAKISLIAGVTKDLTGKVKAGELVNVVATQVGGKGGGRPDMAMAGGSDVAALPQAMASVEQWLADKL